MKKFDLKLTLSLVSLFIGILFLVISGNNGLLVSFGLIFLGISIILFGIYRLTDIDKTLIALKNEISITEIENFEYLDILRKEIKRQKKQKFTIKVPVFVCGAILVVVGIISLF